MDSLLNGSRPPVFCPGCSYDRIVHALDQALVRMGLRGEQVVIVTDIGCSGLLDVFFTTHAFHGLHGRALTYATGLKLARPDLQVIVSMGDGGIGIGGAHFQAACRRNLDMTLLVLNNFNYGMTGGQCSATTPNEAVTASGFLNRLDAPLDICRLADAAGAPYVVRSSALAVDLPEKMEAALRFPGFAVLDLFSICTGRYTRKNKLTPAGIGQRISAFPTYNGALLHNHRQEYGSFYRQLAAEQKNFPFPLQINVEHTPPAAEKVEVLLLGEAGQRVTTAGELLAIAGMTGGLRTTQKNSHDIMVLRGPSISEVILWPDQVGFTAIEQPDVVLALSRQGVNRRKEVFAQLLPDAYVIQASGVDIPPTCAEVHMVDFKQHGIKERDWVLAALAVLAGKNMCINLPMLQTALKYRFQGATLTTALKVIDSVIREEQ
jgi:2-oxoglutarate/2-oxoacid ferredoxin oxidoreductase subunit beta